jgi:hypothetical protein
MVRKKRAPECVGILCGPQISQCNKSNAALVEIKLRGNGSLVCLAMGQTLQLLSNEIVLEGNNGEASLRREGDGRPSRMCHK